MFFESLRKDNLAKVIAEPSLVTISGNEGGLQHRRPVSDPAAAKGRFVGDGMAAVRHHRWN